MRIITHIEVEVIADTFEKVTPNNSIPVRVIESFVRCFGSGKSPDGHVGNTRSVRTIVHTVVEVFVSWESRKFSGFPAD